MARLKKDHSGWRSHGLYKKYQKPTINEREYRPKSKKDTTTWCRGKKGIAHELYREFNYYGYIETKCDNCGKKFYRKDKSIPLRIRVKGETKVTPVQVKINGVAQKLDSKWFRQDVCWCGEFH
jgi:hypothetical protein